MNSTICPENTQCSNTAGSYKCLCGPGYTQTSKTSEMKLKIVNIELIAFKFSAGSSSTQPNCTDIDECSASVSPCPFPYSQTCTNTIGSFTCRCANGFATNTTNTSLCDDINECLENSNVCNDTYANCVNTEGSYLCLCKAYYGRVNGVCTFQELCKFSFLSVSFEITKKKC